MDNTNNPAPDPIEELRRENERLKQELTILNERYAQLNKRATASYRLYRPVLIVAALLVIPAVVQIIHWLTGMFHLQPPFQFTLPFWGLAGLGIPAIIQLIKWIIGLFPLQIFYIDPIPSSIDLRAAAKKFRAGMGATTKTHAFMYDLKSIQDYHHLAFNKIVSGSGIKLVNANYSWEMVFYAWMHEDRMKLAMLPGIVERDFAGKVIQYFDYFDDAIFKQQDLYNSVQLEAYDFGHLKP
jgi:hypothetical protein